jgi:hypothetical protein
MLLRLTVQLQAESFPVTTLDDFGSHCLYNEKLMLKLQNIPVLLQNLNIGV